MRIDREFTIVRMFFFEVVFGFHLGIAIGEDFAEFFNDTFDFIPGEFRTDPNDEARDTVHSHGRISCEKLFENCGK